MQQVKYPQFVQSSTEDINYLPGLRQNHNLQQHQQGVFTNSKQINNQQNYHQLDQPSQQKNSILLKDSNFLIQKFFLGSILGMFILWTFLFVIIFVLMMIKFEGKLYKHKNISSQCLTASVIVLILLIKIGSMEKFRYAGLTLLIYFGSIIAYTFMFFFIITYCSSEPGSDVPNTLIAGLFIISPLFVNSIVTIILLIYIIIETQKFRFYKVVIFEFLCVLPLAIIYIPILISLVIVFPYTFLLINVLKQIQSGRFNLNKDEVQLIIIIIQQQ